MTRTASDFARSVRTMLAALGLAATTAFAQPTPDPPPFTAPPSAAPPSTAPSVAPANRPRWVGRPAPRGNRLLRFRDIAGLAADPLVDAPVVDPPSDEEWQVIGEFARENYPNRWKRFVEAQEKRPDSEAVERIKNRIVAGYRTLKRIEADMPDVYAAALAQGKLEDDAWGASVDARRSPKDAKLQAVMREKVAALVKDVLAERQKRIDALLQAVKAQQEELDRDKLGLDGLIDDQMKWLTSDSPGRPGGGFGPRGP